MKDSRRCRRRALAGVVATVIMFAIIFTAGTSFFIFQGTQANNYVKSLASRAIVLQNAASEYLTVTTKLTGGHIGFYVNNTGSLSVNMTAVIVVDSSGNVLKCDGIGLPAGAGCANTTPALSIVVNIGKGYPGSGAGVIDTGYTYVSGTDTVKVITARGNVFAGSYPSPVTQQISSQVNAQVAVSVGSLLINQQSFRFYEAQAASLGDGYGAQGYDSFAVPSNIKAVFSISVTDEDPNGRGVTLNQKSVISQGGAPSTTTWYILGGISDSSPYTSGVTMTAYSQNSPITINFGSTTTIYFGGSTPGGTGTVPTGSANQDQGIFLLMYGTYSDNSYYSQTIPFEATFITGATIQNSTPTSGCAGSTYTASLQASTWNSGPSVDIVANPSTGAGTIITSGTPTTSSASFKIPAGTAQGYYQIFLDDGINVAYLTFHVNC